jgi:hypothetical protein
MIPLQQVTSALFALVAAQTGVPLGDHGTTGISTAGQYIVGWRIDGGGFDGSLGDPHQDVTLVYQFDSMGRSRNQVEGLADRVREVIVGMSPAGGHAHSLAGNGWTGGLRVQQTTGMPSPEGIDERGTVGVWAMRERFEITVHRA